LATGAASACGGHRVAGIPGSGEGRDDGPAGGPGDSAALGDALARLVADALLRVAGPRRETSCLPRFGVDGYVSAITRIYDRLLAAEGLT
jgi:hypothetical protein